MLSYYIISISGSIILWGCVCAIFCICVTPSNQQTELPSQQIELQNTNIPVAKEIIPHYQIEEIIDQIPNGAYIVRV